VDEVISYWPGGDTQPLRDDHGSRASVVADVEGNDDQVEDRVAEQAPATTPRRGVSGGRKSAVVDVELGAFAGVFHEVGGLFVVSRCREELRAGYAPRIAASRTIRTVGFNPLTVAESLLAGLVFPVRVPAQLRRRGRRGGATGQAVLGDGAAGDPRAAEPSDEGADRVAPLGDPPEEGVWHRIATVVTRGPNPIATAVVALLLLFGVPFLCVNLSFPDDRVLPESADVRQVHGVRREGLSSEDGGALPVVAPDVRDAVPGLPNQIDAYATQLATLPAVTRVDAATGTYRGTGSATQLGCEHGKLVLPPRCSPRLAGFNVDGATSPKVIPWDSGGRQ
jgi:hypothetical protein